MHISEKRKAANRANAAKSTGPRTPQGKIIASANSGRHRILADSIVLDTESRDRFAATLNHFYADYNPQDATERNFVERMAICHWRLIRIYAMESADLRYTQKHQTGADLLEDGPTRALLALRAASNKERHPDPIGRREARYSREFYAALRALETYRERKNTQKTNEATDLLDSKDTSLTNEPIIEAIEPILNADEPTPEPIEPTPGPATLVAALPSEDEPLAA